MDTLTQLSNINKATGAYQPPAGFNPANPAPYNTNPIGLYEGTSSVYGAADSTQAPPPIYVNSNTAPTAAQRQASQAAAISSANDSAINAALGRIPGQQDVGNQNIMNSYNSAFARLTGDQGAANQGITNSRNQTMTSNQTARDNIGSSVRNQNQGLQRLLGSHGAGNSSAASILAPFAAAQQGNIQRSQVQDIYGQNMNALDQNQVASDTGYRNSFGTLAQDKQQKTQDLQSGIDNSRASLLGQRSDAVNNQPQIQALLNAMTQLGLNPTFTPQSVAVKAPDLAKYSYDQAQGPAIGGNVGPAAQQQTGPFYGLFGQDKQKQLNGVA